MPYFTLRLALSLLVTLGLLMLFLYTLKRCRPIRVHKKVSIFLPTLMALIFTIYCFRSSAPKALDLVKMLANTYEVKQVVVEDLDGFHNVRMSDGRHYYYNGFRVRLDKNKVYLVSYTHWSHYIVDIREI